MQGLPTEGNSKVIWSDIEYVPPTVALPTQGRAERLHLYNWITEEEVYVAGKFDDERQGHDHSMKTEGVEGFWLRQIVQYYDRATIFFAEARAQREAGGEGSERVACFFEKKAQQALAKAMMTAKGCVESSIRVYGNMPRPGYPSGDILDWT